jgi:hypothetical protein
MRREQTMRQESRACVVSNYGFFPAEATLRVSYAVVRGGHAFTTFRFRPSRNARTFSTTSSIRRLRAAVLAQAKCGVM